MSVDIQEATSWPVNELGEIVAQAGVGTNTVVGWLPSSMLPLDNTTNKISIVGVQEPSLMGMLNPSITMVKPHGSFETSAGTLGYTLHTTVLCPVPFYAVRLRLYNANASATTGVLVGIAASANMTGGVQAPTGTPTNVLVGGSASITKPACSAGGSTNDAILSEVVTDWNYTTAIARDDGGKGYLLMVREYQPTAGNTEASRSTGLGNTIADVNTYGCASVAHLGDRVTTWGSWTTAVSSIGSAFGIELLTASGVISVGAFGDSTVVGQGGTRNNAGGCTLLGVNRIINNKPIGYYNYAEGGSQTSTYFKLFQNIVASAARPRFAVYCPFSPNDSDKYTRAGTDRQIALFLMFINECRKENITPILLTPCPENGITAPQETFRREIVDTTKSMATSLKVAIIDRDAIYTNYSATTGGFKAGLNADTKHPNPAGYALEAALWIEAFSNY